MKRGQRQSQRVFLYELDESIPSKIPNESDIIYLHNSLRAQTHAHIHEG